MFLFSHFTCMTVFFYTIKSSYLRAINEENDKANNVKNQVTGEYGPVPETARQYKVTIGK